MTKYKTTSEFFRAKRIEAGLTQMETAVALGQSNVQQVSNYERGLCEPSLEIWTQLCEIFGVDRQEFFDVLMEIYVARLKQTMGIKRAKSWK